jgi:hypothetical protein
MEETMRKHIKSAVVLSAELLVAGYVLFAPSLKAEAGDSAEITRLLAEAKTEAVELKNDADHMHSFTNSRMSWESYAGKAEMIKEHVNKTGQLLAKLKDAESEGAPWQQTAVQRIEPLLKELAGNVESTITYLNANPAKIHFSAFKDYVKANYELSSELEALIRDFVNYGESKQKFERLRERLEVTD